MANAWDRFKNSLVSGNNDEDEEERKRNQAAAQAQGASNSGSSLNAWQRYKLELNGGEYLPKDKKLTDSDFNAAVSLIPQTGSVAEPVAKYGDHSDARDDYFNARLSLMMDNEERGKNINKFLYGDADAERAKYMNEHASQIKFLSEQAEKENSQKALDYLEDVKVGRRMSGYTQAAKDDLSDVNWKVRPLLSQLAQLRQMDTYDEYTQEHADVLNKVKEIKDITGWSDDEIYSKANSAATIDSWKDSKSRGENLMSDQETVAYEGLKIEALPWNQRKILNSVIDTNAEVFKKGGSAANDRSKAHAIKDADAAIAQAKQDLINTGMSEAEADEYLEYAQRYSNYKSTNEFIKNRNLVVGEDQTYDTNKLKATGKLLGNSAYSLATWMPGAIEGVFANGKDPAGLGSRDRYSRYNLLNNASEYAESAVVNDVIGSNHEVAQGIYQVLESTAKSYEAALLGGAAAKLVGGSLMAGGMAEEEAIKWAGRVANATTLPIFGSSAYNSAYNEAIERGVSPSKAQVAAIAAGAIEMGTEVFSLDHYWEMAQNRTQFGKNIWVNWAIQSGIEGTEEGASDIANRIADYMINGKDGTSQYERDYQANYEKLREANPNIDERQLKVAATDKTEGDFWLQTLKDVGSGAASGLLMGGSAARQSVKNAKAIEQSNKVLAELVKDDPQYNGNPLQYRADAMVESEEKEIMQKYADKFAKGEKLSLSEQNEIAEVAQRAEYKPLSELVMNEVNKAYEESIASQEDIPEEEYAQYEQEQAQQEAQPAATAQGMYNNYVNDIVAETEAQNAETQTEAIDDGKLTPDKAEQAMKLAGKTELPFEQAVDSYSAFLIGYNESELRDLYKEGQREKLAESRGAVLKTIAPTTEQGTVEGLDLLRNQGIDTTALELEAKLFNINYKVLEAVGDHASIEAQFNTKSTTISFNKDNPLGSRHELGEFMQIYNKEGHDALTKDLMAVAQQMGGDFLEKFDRYKKLYANVEGSKTDIEVAREMTNDLIGTILGSEEGRAKWSEYISKKYDEQTAKNKLQAIVDFLKKLRDRIKQSLSDLFRDNKGNSFQEMSKDKLGTELTGHIDAIIAEFDKALQNYQQGGTILVDNIYSKDNQMDVTPNVKNTISQQVAQALGENSIVETDADGNVMYAQNEDASTIIVNAEAAKNSLKTLNETQKKMAEAMRKNGFSEEDIKAAVKKIQTQAEALQSIAEGYMEMQKALAANIVMSLETDVKKSRQVLRSLVTNGDYSLNVDFLTICKKRQAYMQVLNDLIDDGIFENVKFDSNAIAETNDILREMGFETACLACFVESRRLQIQKWATTFVNEWNEAVRKVNPNAEAFGFSDSEVGAFEMSEEDLLALEKELSGNKKNDKGLLNLGTGAVSLKMERLLTKVPSLAKTLTVGDLIKPSGLANMRMFEGGKNLYSLVLQRYGTATPKINQDFNPYNGEIADLEPAFAKSIGNAIGGIGSYNKWAAKQVIDAINEKHTEELEALPKPIKDAINRYKEKALEEKADNVKKSKSKYLYKANTKNKLINDIAVMKYCYDVGGVRLQSFSDFLIENVLDYFQLVGDLQAKKLPLHAYSKEIAFARIFGMTGMKINMSLIPIVNRAVGKEYAGLVKNAKGEYEYAGWGDFAHHIMMNGQSYVQSIGFKDAIALQLDPRYSKNVGTIAIGISDKHILKMLDDPLIRMVIPYHSSGMTQEYAKRMNIDLYNDYTEYQNTRLNGITVNEKCAKPAELLACDGKAASKVTLGKCTFEFEGHTVTIDGDFNFNESVQRNGDARTAAREYVEWCKQPHDIVSGNKVVGAVESLTPKFSNSPYGYDFTTHENYYKLLEDFNSYDVDDVTPAIQQAVTMTYPEGLSAAQETIYRQRLADSGQFTDAEIEKYVGIAKMTSNELVQKEAKSRNEYHRQQDEVYDEALSRIKDNLRTNHPMETDATKNSVNIDSEGRELSEQQKEFFKDSKAVDDDGSLKVMYHGTENAGFSVFDPSYGLSTNAIFFTDSVDVARGYSGTHDVYSPVKYQSAEEVENAIRSEMGDDTYSVEEKDGKYVLLDEGEFADEFDRLDDVYQGWLDYSGFGGSSANYKVYLNITNPLIVDCKGSNWDTIDYLPGLTTTNSYAEYAHDNGYDGVIFLNITDGGLYNSTSQKNELSTVMAAFNPNQIKSVNNLDPTNDDDIRFSLNIDSDGTNLTEEQDEYFADTKVRDASGRLMVMYHGSRNSFTVFDRARIGSSGAGAFEGAGFNFTPSQTRASSYGSDSVMRGYVKITNPLSAEKKTLTAKQLADIIAKVDPTGDDIIANYCENTKDYRTEAFIKRESLVTAKKILEYADTDVDIYSELSAGGGRANLIQGFENLGYDGLIHYNDDGSIKTAVTFSSNQFKNANNLAPTESDDVRHSVNIDLATEFMSMAQDFDWYHVYDDTGNETDVSNEIDSMAADISQGKVGYILNTLDDILADDDYEELWDRATKLRDSLKGKMDTRKNALDFDDILFSILDEDSSIDAEAASILAEGAKAMEGKPVDVTKLRGLAIKLRNEFGSNYSVAKFTENLEKAFAYMQGREHVNYNDVMSILREVARPVIEQATYPEGEEFYKEFTSYFKGRTIKLSDAQKKEAAYLAGSYGDYCRSMMPIRIGNNGTPLELMWDEISDMFPGEIPSDTSEGDMVYVLSDALANRRPKPKNLYEGNTEEVAKDLSMRIVEEYFGNEAGKKMNKLLSEYKERVRENAKNKAQNAKERAEQNKQKKIIKALAKEMQTWVLSVSEDKHVPAKMKAPIMSLLNAIDFVEPKITFDEKKGIYSARIYVEREMNGKLVFQDVTGQTKEEVVQKANDLIQNGFGSMDQKKWAKRMLSIKEMFDLAASEDGNKDENAYFNNILNMLDSTVAKSFSDMISRNADIDINNMSSADLKILSNAMKGIMHAVRNENKAFTQKAFISDWADRVIKHSDTIKLKNHTRLVNAMRKTFMVDMATPDTAFELQGEAGREIFESFTDAFDRKTRDIMEAQAFLTNLLANSKMTQEELDAISGDKADIHTFHVGEGQIELTKGMIMSLYVLNRRDQAVLHFKGGIEADTIRRAVDKAGLVKQEVNQNTPVHMTDAEIKKITDTLSEKEKLMALAIQKYMAVECAAKGNETSMLMYGCKKFLDPNYFPISVDKTTTQTKKEGAAQQVLNGIERMGITKEVNKLASNPLIVKDIFDVYVDHTTDMAAYHGFAPAIKDFLRFYNYKFSEDIGNGFNKSVTVKRAINTNFGRTDNAGCAYFEKLILDITGGEKSGEVTAFWEGIFGSYKGAAIGANLRVVVQQPTAIVRAANVMDWKYIVAGIEALKPGTHAIDRITEISPLAWWKSQGYYETSLGKPIRDIITGQRSVKDKIIDKSMYLAGKADDITWTVLYTAAEIEQRDLLKGQNLTEEEFTERVNKRFNKVIAQTQVVDSVLQKSQWMRGKSFHNAMQTSFMAEPIKSYNMAMLALISDMRDGVKQSKFKRSAKALTILALTNMVNAAAQSFIDALRHKKDDDKYMEKWLEYIGKNFLDNSNPFGLVPGVKDIVQLVWTSLKGETSFGNTSTMEMQAISSITDALAQFSKTVQDNPKRKSGYAAYMIYAKAISTITGIPLYNLSREFTSIYNALPYDDLRTKALTGSDYMDDINVALEKGDQAKIQNEVTDAVESGLVNIKTIRDRLKNQFKSDYFTLISEGRYDEAKVLGEQISKVFSATLMTDEEIDAMLEEWTQESATYKNLDSAITLGDGIEEEVKNLLDAGKKPDKIIEHVMKNFGDTVEYEKQFSTERQDRDSVDAAIKAVDPQKTYESVKADMDAAAEKEAAKVEGLNNLYAAMDMGKYGDLNSVTSAIKTLKDAGIESTTIKDGITDAYKPEWIAAYKAKDRAKMDQIKVKVIQAKTEVDKQYPLKSVKDNKKHETDTWNNAEKGWIEKIDKGEL